MADLTTILLEHPIERGETSLTSFGLRRPLGGDLRGISGAKLSQFDYEEVRKLIPRISVPTVLDIEVDRFDAADITQIHVALSDFLFTKAMLGQSSTM